MTKNLLISTSSLIMFVILIAGVTSGNIRTALWSDPLCHKFSTDGSYCLECSFRAFMDDNSVCQQVSDWCNTWNEKTGECTSCYQGYGKPINGVCNGAIVGEV